MVNLEDCVEERTRRILLRRLRLDDAPDVHLVRSRPEVMLYTPTLPETNIAQSEAWIRGCLSRRNCYNFAVEELPTEDTDAQPLERDADTTQRSSKRRVIGIVGVTRTPEIGYLFHPDFWGKGLTTEALRAFMPLYWKHTEGKYDYAEGKVDSGNHASRRILLKCGFTLWDEIEKNFESPTLGVRDTEIYRVPRPGTILQAKMPQ